MAKHLGLPPHHSHLRVDPGTPSCDWCGEPNGSGVELTRDGRTVYCCGVCVRSGKDRTAVPEVARETLIAAPTGEPAIPMRPLRQAGQNLKHDPLEGLGELGIPKK